MLRELEKLPGFIIGRSNLNTVLMEDTDKATGPPRQVSEEK